ncbi:MAG TPA: hypothetical protein PK684_06645 [Bacillota bacterium]|jgi:hypothetical protein|nr:hypothetical protein [Bacillota bacterium]
MEIILKERNRQEKVSGGRVLLFIIATVLFINLAAALINRFAPVAAGVASLLLILAVMVIAYRVMTGKATEYYYILTDRGLLIHRAMGIREIKLMEIPFDGIIEIKPGEETGGTEKTYYFLCNRKDSRRMTLVFEYRGKKTGVVFAPSREFLEALLGLTGRA